MNIQVPVEAVSDAISRNTPPLPRWARWRRLGVVLAVSLIAGAASYVLLNRGPSAPAVPAVEVTVAPPLVHTITEWDDYVGRFTPSQTVDVRPRVSGQVVERHFADGDIVKKDQVLFTIDQRPFLAAQAEARATVESSASALALAQSDLARAQRLKGDEAVSQGEIDQLRSRVRSALAAVAAAQARLRSRDLDVEFTEVRAPISGRISDRRVDVGNLVVGGDSAGATLLTTINAVDPIYFTFDASEALFLKAQRERQKGAPATTVQIRLQDETDYRWTGQIDFTDNGLDPHSGTMRGRAVLANPEAFLTPGLFGDMRFAAGAPTHALLIPDSAIQSDQARKTVLVVDDDDNVIVKPVTLGPKVEGLRVIHAGLTLQDRVVIEGMQNAFPGSKVVPHAGQVVPETMAAAATNETPVASQASLTR